MRLFYKNVLVTDTLYSIVLYFLLTKSVKQFTETLFVVSNGIPRQIRDKLTNVIYEDVPSNVYYQSKKKVLRLKFLKMFRFNWRFLFAAHYALDHMPYVSQYLGLNRYSLLEDSPGIFCRIEESIGKGKQISSIQTRKSIKNYIKAFVFHGGCWGGAFGQNSFCNKIIITDARDSKSSLLKGKRIVRVDLKTLWDKKDNQEKNWLISFLDLDLSDLEKWKEAETVILTQPWITDGILSQREYINCYLPSIEKYGKSNVIIKPHPRDFFNWEEEFPGVQVMKTVVPMQVLSCCGLQFKRAITVSSSAVVGLPAVTEVVWLGNEASPTLLRKYGKEKWIP